MHAAPVVYENEQRLHYMQSVVFALTFRTGLPLL